MSVNFNRGGGRRKTEDRRQESKCDVPISTDAYLDFDIAAARAVNGKDTRSYHLARRPGKTRRSRDAEDRRVFVTHHSIARQTRPDLCQTQEIISGALRGTGGVTPAGIPTIIGAMVVISAGIFSSAFHSGVFSAETANPMTQVPRP